MLMKRIRNIHSMPAPREAMSNPVGEEGKG
jgi:hypothetical protein